MGGHGIYACDFDNDDDMDIITCASDNNEVNWFENNGSGNFSKNDIDSQTLDPGYVHCSDIDNNGLVDIIGMSFELKQLSWWHAMTRIPSTFLLKSFRICRMETLPAHGTRMI